ncbi:hypothetical protein MKX03_008165, partial [Papaver bracteatum]
KRAKYKENCEKKVVRHTLGRILYAQKSFNLVSIVFNNPSLQIDIKLVLCHGNLKSLVSFLPNVCLQQLKDGVIIDGRPEIWMEGHIGKDGAVHPSAVDKFELVRNAHEKRNNLAKDGDLSAMDFDNDAITDVFGPDKGKGYFRAFSSHLTKSQAATSTLAVTVNASKASSSEGPKEDSVLVDMINNLSKDFHDYVVSQHGNKVPSVDASIPTTVCSNSSVVDAMGNEESTDGKTQYVNLLNKKEGSCERLYYTGTSR